MSFFDKLKGEKKVNLFLGDFIGRLIGYPTRAELCKILSKEMKEGIKSYIKNDNSLFQISQGYLDAVVDSRSNLLNKLKGFYEYKKIKSDFYETILNSGKINSIVTINFDTSLEDFYSDRVIKNTVYCEELKDEEGKIPLYKMLGDFDNLEKVCVSNQDFRKLCVLPFYKKFWEEVRDNMNNYPTVFLGTDLDDPDFLYILEKIAHKKELNNMYMITSSSVVTPHASEILNNYGIKILKEDEMQFLRELKNNEEIITEEVVLEKKMYR
ncbi:MAG: SIR2 family protein [Cetobacterium sp.]|uniref:SIR2-like domain-containing protein n=1 Tax=Cetobacterium ceti TaxID=180163 RepID=A0A1T4K587_9FUSO|nr:SIR2 family protein [Cetobacterium ceti]MCJ8342665.1 SIR2 family protein [Cetobacterium sp.]SJZ37594.1 SIR2-like domain-containing protein [Cetobacterium ceti]